MNSSVRVRFAPSPTGYLHIGGARTALFNWLYARHTGGKFILRIEDTDRQRNTKEAVRVIFDGLRWLGIDWDEGPEKGGAFGPYFQSQRGDIYTAYLEKLEKKGMLYEDNGAIRFRSPRVPVVVKDLICGEIEFDRSREPDMTLRRPDGSWIFHFVNVVDDLTMGINTVIRGEDHLSNTPKHLELYAALDAEPPRFAHIPLILNRDGSKMSKRDAGSSITTYIEEGYVPEAVRNYLCLLGWSSKDDREKIAIEEIIERFEIAQINRGNAAFDAEKLRWLAGEYTRELSFERFEKMGYESLKRAGIDLSEFSDAYIQNALKTCEGKIHTFSELPEYAGFYFKDEFTYDEEAKAKQFTAENKSRLQLLQKKFNELSVFDAATIESTMKLLAKELGIKVGAIIHPARLACTGASSGPSLYHLLEVLGKEKVDERFTRALALADAWRS